MQEANDNQSVLKGQTELGLKEFATKLCISAALAVGLLAAGECVAYVLLPPRAAPPADYKSYVLWQVARPITAIISVGGDGLRRTYYSHCEANEYTIWMFGSSNLWGPSSHDWETIPSLVAKHFEDSGRRVCVRNFGQPGWVSTQEVIQLLLELKRAKKKPDVVIFYDGTGDSFLPWESDEVDVHQGFPSFKNKFESWSFGEQAGFDYLRSTNTYLAFHLAARKLELIDEVVPRSISAEQATLMARRVLSNYLKNIEIVGILAAHYKFQYVCFWEPSLVAAQRPLSASEELIRKREEKKYPGVTEVKTATYELFRAVNWPHFVYLGDFFKDPNETLFVDLSHFRTEGNRLVAERICQALQQLGS